jgi:hypothetical protein
MRRSPSVPAMLIDDNDKYFRRALGNAPGALWFSPCKETLICSINHTRKVAADVDPWKE